MPSPDRVVDLSEAGAHLSIRDGLLHIRAEAGQVTVPLEELAVVMAAHPAVTFTHAALSSLAQAGVIVVCCDERRLPAAMLLPVQGHHIQAERFQRQAQVTEPTRKRLWQQLVKAKIAAQARVLAGRGQADEGLEAMVDRVRSGDPENIEAQAARRYWQRLFPDGFRRDPLAEDQNRLLNYGYAVVRGVVARCVVGAGLHPSLGLNHHNRYNTFCLADDLIEPFRPLVDRVVAAWVDEHGPTAPFDRAAKTALLSAAMGRVHIDGEDRKVHDAAFRLASSLQAVYEGRARRLIIPEV